MEKLSLKRSSEDRLIVGVCGGLANYFQVDPILIRGIFAILFVLTFELAVLLYLGLWFLMPDEEPSQELIPLKKEGESPIIEAKDL